MYGYIHKTVNHAVKFVNDQGFNNKIEGHWRQMKARLPMHGRKKEHHSSYLAELKWSYIHSGEDLLEVGWIPSSPEDVLQQLFR